MFIISLVTNNLESRVEEPIIDRSRDFVSNLEIFFKEVHNFPM